MIIAAYILAPVVVVLAVIVALASTRPDTFRLARTQSIKAPPEKIFPLIADLRRLNVWNPFVQKDPAIKLTYRGPESGPGAINEWEGNRQVGKGSLEIVEASPSSKLRMKLDMIAPIAASNTIEFTLAPHRGATDVTWSMEGRVPLIAKVLHMFCSMDRMVGGQFEAGLSQLKALAEA